jgi:hypothetical protein
MNCVRSITIRTSPARAGAALFGWVVASGMSVAACGGGGPPPASEPPTLAARAGSALAQMIRMDTTNPPGNERALAEWLAGYLEAEGVEVRVVPLPDADSPRAALWARVAGSGAGRPLILLSHLDVVPADARAWSLDPSRASWAAATWWAAARSTQRASR